MSRNPSTEPSATPANAGNDNDDYIAHIAPAASPLSPVAPHAQTEQAVEQPVIDPVTLCRAANDLKAYWPLVLRFAILMSADAAKAYVIAQKELDLLGAYAAYNTLTSVACYMLYGSIFPVVTLMSEAKREEDEAIKQNNEEKIRTAQEKIRLIWRQGILFATLLSVPAVILGCTASPLFTLFKQPEVVLKNSRDFLLYSTPGFVADIFYRLTARTVTGLGVKKSILMADSFDRILEIGFSYALLNGKFGLPELGIPGVAVAYSVSKAVTLLAHLAYIYASPACCGFDYTKYNLFKCDGSFFDAAIFKKLVKAGVPNGLSSIISAVSAMLVAMFCGQSGTAPLVGIQIASVYSGLVNFHGSAVLNAACNQIGQYFSILSNEEKKYTKETVIAASHNAKAYAKLLFPFCVFISTLSCGLTFLIPRQLATVLIDETNTAHQSHLQTTMTFLKIQGVFEMLRGVEGPTSAILNAILDNRFILFATIVLDLMANSGAAAAAHYALHKNANWVFAASGLGFAVMTMVFAARAYHKLSALPSHSDDASQVVTTTHDINSHESAHAITVSVDARSQSCFFGGSLNADHAAPQTEVNESTRLLAQGG